MADAVSCRRRPAWTTSLSTAGGRATAARWIRDSSLPWRCCCSVPAGSGSALYLKATTAPAASGVGAGIRAADCVPVGTSAASEKLAVPTPDSNRFFLGGAQWPSETPSGSPSTSSAWPTGKAAGGGPDAREEASCCCRQTTCRFTRQAVFTSIRRCRRARHCARRAIRATTRHNAGRSPERAATASSISNSASIEDALSSVEGSPSHHSPPACESFRGIVTHTSICPVKKLVDGAHPGDGSA